MGHRSRIQTFLLGTVIENFSPDTITPAPSPPSLFRTTGEVDYQEKGCTFNHWDTKEWWS